MGRFAIEFWGVPVAVEWDLPALDAAVGELLLPVWEHRPDLQPEHVFTLSTSAEGETVLSGPEGVIQRHRSAVVESLERSLHLYLASETRECVYVHAGVVVWQGAAILLPGRSYAGKTTLVHALVRAGARFFSDEYAIIDPQGWVHTFPRPLSLRQAGGVDRRVAAVELGWQPGHPPVRARAIIACRYEGGEAWAPEEITPGDAALELLSNTVSAQAAPQLALTCLTQAVRGAFCWRGKRGDADETAALLLGQLTDLGK